MNQLLELPAYRRLSLEPVAAEGSWLVLADGRRVLDLYGGHCVCTLGAGDPGLRDVLGAQWRRLSFATNLVPLEGRAGFLDAFGANLPDAASGWRVFLSNSGAEANENALKGALDATTRGKIVSFSGGFHGRTAAAAAVTGGRTAWGRAPFDVVQLPFGDEGALASIDDATAGVIVEPIQSMAGVVAPPDGWLAALRARCDAVGAVLIFDEVQTGSGRLGSPFAAQHFGVTPDAITTAKGAAGGLPVGVTVFTGAVAERLDPSGFGSTFGGGPLALAAATEVARRVASHELVANVKAIEAAVHQAAQSGPVRAVRGAGCLLGLELEEGWSAKDVQSALLAQGILTGTSNDPRVLRLSPALTLDATEAGPLLAAALAGLEVAV